MADLSDLLPAKIEGHENEILLFLLQMMYQEKEWLRASSMGDERWWGTHVKVLLLYALCGIEPDDRDFPYSNYDIKAVMAFWQRAPHVIKELCEDLYDEMVERCAQRDEDWIRSRVVNHNSFSKPSTSKPPVTDIAGYDAQRYV